MGRNRLAIKSSLIGVISQVVSIVMQFIIRTVLINYLGVQILGLDGVIRDYIAMLSLTDMGIQSAMIFRLYKGIINNDTNYISKLMTVYRKIYRTIAILILIIGIILSCFLTLIIKGLNLEWSYIYAAYYLQLIVTVASYLLAYKRSLLAADQKQYICILADTIFNFLLGIVKIGVIIILKSYLLYIITGLIQTIISNLFIHLYCFKKYPNIKVEKTVNRHIMRELLSDAFNVFAGKIASYIYSSTDNLIISAFLNTIAVGYLSNYKYIAVTLRNFVNCMVSPIQSLIGNYLNSIEDRDKSFQLLNNYTHIRYVIALCLMIPAICLSDLFVELWAGTEYLQPLIIIILLIMDFYIGCVYGPLGEYIIGLGMFKYEKYATSMGAITNIVLSLVGVFLFGTKGVLLATVISQIVLWISKSFIVFQYYFNDVHKKYRDYWIKQGEYIVFAIIMVFICKLVIGKIIISHLLLRFIISGIVIEVIIGLSYVAVFGRTKEFKEALRICTKR